MLPFADVGGRLVLGGATGLAAAVVTDWPMSRQPEGFTPAFVATSLVRRTSPDAVSFRDATVLHHATGVLAGMLYALVLIGMGGVLPSVLPVGGVDLLAHLSAVGGVIAFNYLAFSHVVLPRSGGHLTEERATAVRGQWLRSSLVFGAAVLVVAPVLFAAV